MNRHTVKWAILASTFTFIGPFINDVNAQWSSPVENESVIVGGWLFDGTSDERKPNPGIVIRNGKIALVGLPPESESSSISTVIELDPEATILPGFIDLHAHYNYDLVDQGRAEEVKYTGIVFLANGVTSTWSAGEFYPHRVLEHRDRLHLDIGPFLKNTSSQQAGHLAPSDGVVRIGEGGDPSHGDATHGHGLVGE